MLLEFDEAKVRDTLLSSWSRKTALQWTQAAPWNGQCNVTATAVCLLFGGEILRTPWNEHTDHYYNRLNDERFDFTDKQFEKPIEYRDTATTIDEVRATIPASEIDELKHAFLANWRARENVNG